ncbi:hypothetical protein LV84_00329 [Algoriphagus ratkowskyi]|uniref:Uncharacterized protein n=1 Tax=Algoriphagus ratkowskyi TaxID=57028 RepID=A0A2W7RM51_9BACT|nr:hypothetical protein [Algoriphagus ratkowskyi]PZX61341.1 hypothetical protein LV84_00329 [Algoriphagus ratkowskyi]TXD79443.1 hypothetical protein ESW18_04240 [Algoriphagus ratkowskyi]
MKELHELKERDLLEIQGGGLSEITEAFWDGVGYVARVYVICCEIAVKTDTYQDPMYYSK